MQLICRLLRNPSLGYFTPRAWQITNHVLFCIYAATALVWSETLGLQQVTARK